LAFFGYVRPDGSVGTRNHVLILPQGFISSKICQWVPGTRTIVTPQSGAGRTAEDRETIARLLIGLGRNPNVASVILHTATTGSGYPELRTERLADEIAAGGKRVEVVDQARDGGTYGAIVKGVQLARRMVYEASRLRREEVPDECLSIGVKCGYSDTTSGVAGNPAVGYLMDSVVASGGTALFGETTEVIGAEQVLARRAVNSEVAEVILGAVNRVEAKAKATGYDIRTVNPAPANIRGGISSLEEKSLGAIHKAGSAPIQGCLQYAERPTGKGLYFVDNWMGHPSSLRRVRGGGDQPGAVSDRRQWRPWEDGAGTMSHGGRAAALGHRESQDARYRGRRHRLLRWGNHRRYGNPRGSREEAVRYREGDSLGHPGPQRDGGLRRRHRDIPGRPALLDRAVSSLAMQEREEGPGGT